MGIIAWNNNLSVGIKEIDDQHKKLIQILNDFYAELEGGQSTEATKKLLNSLLDYTVFHFSNEEKYFERFKYPNRAAHMQKHKEFINQVKETKQQIESGKFVLSLKVTNFVKDWIVKHITVEDKKYVECFTSNGLR